MPAPEDVNLDLERRPTPRLSLCSPQPGPGFLLQLFLSFDLCIQRSQFFHALCRCSRPELKVQLYCRLDTVLPKQGPSLVMLHERVIDKASLLSCQILDRYFEGADGAVIVDPFPVKNGDFKPKRGILDQERDIFIPRWVLLALLDAGLMMLIPDSEYAVRVDPPPVVHFWKVFGALALNQKLWAAIGRLEILYLLQQPHL
mmetsp:Transcript_13883/g.27743  ORF Transcript_13883/g.27743 Transcript_13883/m.27743 type:complete len:201 (-) Transcript_13883:942-1544(-)